MSIISNTALRLLKAGQKYSLKHPLGDNLAADVHLKPTENKIQIKAQLITLDPHAKVEGVSAMTRTCKNLNVLEIDVRDTCIALHVQLNGKAKKERATHICTGFAQRVLELPDITNPENFREFVKKGWGQETAKNAVSYYAHTIGEVYERFGLEASREEFAIFREEEIAKIYKTKYIHPCKDGLLIKHRREDIFNGVNTRFGNAAVVQKYLLKAYPDMGWPSVPIPVSPRCRTGRMEEIKTITYKQYITTLVLLKRSCEVECPYAYAALTEALGAARIGESCAPLVGDFEIRGDYCRYYVDYQIDKNRKRTNVLKNEQSHRYIYFGHLMIDMIHLRTTQLEGKGYTSEEINEIPFASTAEKPHEFLDKGKVSGFVRKILVLAGCDEEWLQEEAERMYIAAEVAGNRDDVDIGAHELRSTLATFWANGGMKLNTLDAVLGHENPSNKKEDYATWDTAERIAKEIERAVYLGSLAATNNPAFTPVVVTKDVNFSLQGNTAYYFTCQEDMYIELDIETLEGNDAITIVGPQTLRCADIVRREIPDAMEDKKARPVLPALPSEDDIERWIREAYAIDLTEIIERYGM